MQKLVALGALVVLLTGCAIGRTANYRGALPLSVSRVDGHPSVVVAVQDQRPDVLNGRKWDTYVGTQRSIAGVPWNMRTASGRPLASEIGEDITAGLVSAGFNAHQLSVTPQQGDDDVLVGARSLSPGSKIYHFRITEWCNDIWFIPTLSYCIELMVKDASGAMRARKSACGKQDLGSDKPGFENLAKALATILDSLIDANEVKSALRNGIAETSPNI